MGKTATLQNTERGRPAQYSRASRKGKKSWRKNIDLTATEASLEDAREQERVLGTPAHTQSNAQLFQEDRSGQETQLARQAREKRKLKSQEILEARSAVPAIQQRARSAFHLDTQTPAGKANAAGLPAKVKRRLRILASRPHEGEQGRTEIGSAGKLQSDVVLADKHDLWGPESKPSIQADEQWVTTRTPHNVNVKASRTQAPHSRVDEPMAAAKSARIIQQPHAGTSYNPDYDQHEALLQKAIQNAISEEATEQETKRLREQWHGVVDAPAGQVAPDLPLDDAASQASDGSGLSDEEHTGSRTKMPKRKSSAQRRREARAKEQQIQAEQRRLERQQRAIASQLPAHLKSIRKHAQARQLMNEERQARKLERIQKEGIAGFRVGKHTVPKQRIDVQTGDELSESLRRLKPEGNLFWDQFQNLQARGLVEARRPVAPSRRYQKRVYDRHSFKRDD
ncbi:hypothetical protein MYAM1_003128 [Malassezia yamatoensis]|uniref:Ribosome biogenesis protein NOP53 n=1 Tax=Malassezia yamatoensis TaxID=253288 RepID=A0AAJ6CHY8_9BASI|nr:hypothetical protein MYAM1_003128 [Malassezia yamatoensis]